MYNRYAINLHPFHIGDYQKSGRGSDYGGVLIAKEIPAALADITPQGYNLIHKPRPGKRGGGVAIVTNNKFDVSPCKIPQHSSFESNMQNISSAF